MKNKFSHHHGIDNEWVSDGLRDFFEYCDLGIKDATNGKLLVQLTRARKQPDEGTGWHFHVAEFHVVYMLRGYAKFMYGDQDTTVEQGDCIHQRPGIIHYLYDYSPDMMYMEIISPANFPSIPHEAPKISIDLDVLVPKPLQWIR